MVRRFGTALTVAALAGGGVLIAAAPPGAHAVARRTATVYAPGGGVALRNGPTVTNRLVGAVRHGARLSVRCQMFGQGVRSRLRYSGHWDKLTSGAYLPDAYVAWRPNRSVSWCTTTGVRAVATAYTRRPFVTIHRGSDLRQPVVGRLRNRQAFTAACQRWGQRVTGPTGVASPVWNVLATGRHLPDAATLWRPARPSLPWCGQAPWTAAPGRAAFIRQVAPGARAGRLRHRVPASVTIAQAILESGWGTSQLTRRDHNYFGIKCHGNPYPDAIGCRTYATHECGRGRCWRTSASFRVYRDLRASVVAHGRWLAGRPRYAGAFRYHRSPDRFARAIHAAGYATSPTYAAKLIRIMRQYRLYRFDR